MSLFQSRPNKRTSYRFLSTETYGGDAAFHCNEAIARAKLCPVPRDNPYTERRLAERLKSRHGAAHDECMHIMRAFIGIHGFQIQHMADHAIFVGHAVAA